MTSREMLVLFVAIAGGTLGGAVAARLRSPSPGSASLSAASVRTSRIEIVDTANHLAAVLSAGTSGRAALSFFDQHGNSVASIGVQSQSGILSPSQPYIEFAGSDGKARAVLSLSSIDQPRLILRDSKQQTRAYLGAFEPNDYVATPENTRWGMSVFGDLAILYPGGRFLVPPDKTHR